jgi:hypothetical protein
LLSVDGGSKMEKFEEYLNVIKTKDKMSEDEILDAANHLIAVISDKKELLEPVIESIDDIYDNDLELIKIRAVEIALKLLDYTLYNNDKNYALKIFEFLKQHIGDASENIQTAVIIHYSWAYRKFPSAKKIIKLYYDMIAKFNENKIFYRLYEYINQMEGVLQ